MHAVKERCHQDFYLPVFAALNGMAVLPLRRPLVVKETKQNSRCLPVLQWSLNVENWRNFRLPALSNFSCRLSKQGR